MRKNELVYVRIIMAPWSAMASIDDNSALRYQNDNFREYSDI